MDQILKLRNKMKLLLRDRDKDNKTNPFILSFQFQKMTDLVEAFDSLPQILKDNKLVKKKIKRVEENYKRIEENYKRVEQDLQVIKSRDILNSIQFKQLKLVHKHPKLKLGFVSRSKLENDVDLSLKSLIQDGNVLAHHFAVENVYASLTDPTTFDAIFKVLQQRLSRNVNLESLSRSDFRTLVAGVPVTLIQHALGRLESSFFLLNR